ncbi:class I SAM-dependent methyltransferase [Micromonospora polyrhachis]|uniref:SAM-dependent methyltransferase n=1 Tax=Micromonospora polyrhachis TaxID=1282883 RepID=A0A7W7WR13_9ACTN|nr:class I SAM-dependent methyltransferase [Micromonospora polyrhachis]MBB4960856.1 SAM-dependent methyltransferase [Micromonospora polyrhachis]
MLAAAKGLLGHVPLYVTLQRGLGADRLRYRCLDELSLADGDTVIDVGCGPAYYFERLPRVRYYGFDTAPRYIEYARNRWGSDRAEFRCEVFGAEHLSQVPPADAVLLLGLLHHLSDEESRHVLRVAARALAPGGRVIAVDTCYEPRQGRISRWMSDNDRGEHVREPAGFTALARESFEEVDGEIIDDVTRIPSSFWLMRMRKPLH